MELFCIPGIKLLLYDIMHYVFGRCINMASILMCLLYSDEDFQATKPKLRPLDVCSPCDKYH